MGIAANGTVEPKGLPYILPLSRIITCTTVAYILSGQEADVFNDDDIPIFYYSHTKIHVQGYRTSIQFAEDITTKVLGSATLVHLQGYRTDIC